MILHPQDLLHKGGGNKFFDSHFPAFRVKFIYMFPPVPTKDASAVQAEVQTIYSAMFPDSDRLFVDRAFSWTIDCFNGTYRDYQPVDARYHDLEHTMQGTLCMARLLQGRHLAGAQPHLTQHLFELGLLAILLHDTGYLKKRGDTEGTGAKYTATHVDRSADFAGELLRERGFTSSDIEAVQNMIHCTGVNIKLDAIPFQSELERIVGCALGTADLLGQMAADDYVDKLPTLYEEFAEAREYTKENSQFIASFSSAEDLIQKTPAFWKAFVKAKLESDFLGLYRFLQNPYPSGPNYYLDQIEANMARLSQLLAESAG